MVAAFPTRTSTPTVWEPAFSDGRSSAAGSKVLATDKDTPIY
jgi:hypothetical protein